MLSETWTFITAWYNLPFSILLFLCLLFTALQLFGLGGEQDSDADLDTDFDADADLDADFDAAADLDTDFDADADLDADADADLDGDTDLDQDGDFHLDRGDGLSALSLFAFIGVGKAPLFVVLIVLFGSMGILGWVLNNLVETVFNSYPALALAPVGLLSLLGSGLVSSRVTRFIGQMLPPVSTTATRAEALVGRRGTVLSPSIDKTYGLVRLRDQGGTSINVFAIVADEDAIDRDSEVLLVDYDPTNKRYTVTRRS